MNLISLETQRKIMLAPFCNVLNLFVCLYNCCASHVSFEIWLKAQPYLFGFTFPPAILFSIVSEFIPQLEFVMTIATVYLVPLIMGYGLIKFQEKYLPI